MKKHLIVEGMDGSGKDTLIERIIATDFGRKFQIHRRASTSLGGPVPDLEDWVEMHNDPKYLLTTGPWIFNRHPLFSERIYAPYREVNRGLSGEFRNNQWIGRHRRCLAFHSILIIVSPPFDLVEKALIESGSDAHMPGVWSNRSVLYEQYRNLTWPGTTIRYDRTRQTAGDLLVTLSHMMKDSQ